MPALIMYRKIVLVIYTAMVIGLSLSRGPAVPRPEWMPKHIDKIAHFGMYGLYVLLIACAAPARCRHNFPHMAAMVAYCIVFGIAMEILQPILNPNVRFFSVGDIIANALGAVCMAAIILCFEHCKAR